MFLQSTLVLYGLWITNGFSIFFFCDLWIRIVESVLPHFDLGFTTQKIHVCWRVLLEKLLFPHFWNLHLSLNQNEKGYWCFIQFQSLKLFVIPYPPLHHFTTYHHHHETKFLMDTLSLLMFCTFIFRYFNLGEFFSCCSVHTHMFGQTFPRYKMKLICYSHRFCGIKMNF